MIYMHNTGPSATLIVSIFVKGQGKDMVPRAARRIVHHMGPIVKDFLIKVLFGTNDECNTQGEHAVQTIWRGLVPRVLGVIQ